MKYLRSASLLALMLVSVCALAQSPRDVQLHGIIDSAGQWTVRGHWSLKIEERSNKAEFSADLNMQRSDYWLIANSKPDDATDLGQHTHHISVVGPVNSINGGFEITGLATITVNGSPAPVSPSMVTIDVTGGDSLEYSNIAVTFASPASKHFGTDPLTGVVRTAKSHREDH